VYASMAFCVLYSCWHQCAHRRCICAQLPIVARARACNVGHQYHVLFVKQKSSCCHPVSYAVDEGEGNGLTEPKVCPSVSSPLVFLMFDIHDGMRVWHAAQTVNCQLKFRDAGSKAAASGVLQLRDPARPIPCSPE
jgi:hypothetical protein